MEPTSKGESRYERIRKIGVGSYGVVFKCVNRQTGQVVAIKRYSENDSDPTIRKIAMREVRMLRQLQHPNLIRLIEVFRRKRRLHLVFDYCELTVLDVIEKYASECPLNLVKKIVWQLVNGVNYCHLHNCIHRDIKPENILINQSGIVKLCDFGFARTIANRKLTPKNRASNAIVAEASARDGSTWLKSESQQVINMRQVHKFTGMTQAKGKENDATSCETNQRDAMTDYVATRWYRAPELLVGDTFYDEKIDIWAIGCVTAELIRGEPLWPGKTDLDQLFMITNSLGKLTPRQTQVLAIQLAYDKSSIEKLIQNTGSSSIGECDVPTVGRDPDLSGVAAKLSGRVGTAGAEFVASCLRMDPTQRPSCGKLLRHEYIRSARMAHFVKGMGHQGNGAQVPPVSVESSSSSSSSVKGIAPAFGKQMSVTRGHLMATGLAAPGQSGLTYARHTRAIGAGLARGSTKTSPSLIPTAKTTARSSDQTLGSQQTLTNSQALILAANSDTNSTSTRANARYTLGNRNTESGTVFKSRKRSKADKRPGNHVAGNRAEGHEASSLQVAPIRIKPTSCPSSNKLQAARIATSQQRVTIEQQLHNSNGASLQRLARGRRESSDVTRKLAP